MSPEKKGSTIWSPHAASHLSGANPIESKHNTERGRNGKSPGGGFEIHVDRRVRLIHRKSPPVVYAQKDKERGLKKKRGIREGEVHVQAEKGK